MEKDEHYLFIGAGGMGMAPLACWMSQAGYSVCGYDAHLQERVRYWLAEAGVSLCDFIFPEQVCRYTTVVYSSAVSQSHPILHAARAAGLRLLRRGEMLAEIARGMRLIAVVGSHGKTTTSGMIAHAMRRSGVDCHYILGGLFADGSLPPSYHASSSWLLAEVDESDGTIDGFSPEVTVVLNVDWDHADRYAAAVQLEDAFRRLLDRSQGAVILPAGFHLSPRTDVPVATFNGAAAHHGLQPPPPGRFNQVNGDAAVTVLSRFSEQLEPNLLASFPGMARRQSKLFDSPQLTIVEDYAHHPTEVDALLECLKENEPDKQLVVVFQPHRYSRTRQFKAAFAQSLQVADAVYLLPVYAAHEVDATGGETADLIRAFPVNTVAELPMSLAGIRSLFKQLGLNERGAVRVVAASTEAGDQPLGNIGPAPIQLAFVGAGDIEEFAGAFTSWVRAGAALEEAWLDYLQPRLSSNCLLKLQEPLANKTTIRIGGAARFYAEPANLSDLRVLLRAAKIFDLETFCLGRGSNLLVSDHGFEGLVIRFSSEAWRQVDLLGDGRIWAAAGGRLKQICGFAAKHGLGGFEFLEGIPGSVGGALRMNAGAMGSWMFDLVERVQFIDEFGCYHDCPKEAFHFGYRKVEEISRGIALGAVLSSVTTSTEPAIRQRIESYSSTRKDSQPRGASAGCIFKNPEGNFAGKLIDQLGIKGMSVGAAEVSAVHGNFIVNHGGATAADVIELVRQIRAKVQAEAGYLLEPEVLLVGQSWDEILSE
jgi:UDP-N-acetylenolpyruvoylglucosamine reductase